MPRLRLSVERFKMIDVLFTGEGPHLEFVECEEGHGRSINAGEWRTEGDYQVLRIKDWREEVTEALRSIRSIWSDAADDTAATFEARMAAHGKFLAYDDALKIVLSRGASLKGTP